MEVLEKKEVQKNYWKNAVKKIDLYKQGRSWVFDDEFLELKAEPFVLGASESIDFMVKMLDLENKKTPTVVFGEKLPEYDFCIHLIEDTKNSGWYMLKVQGIEKKLWLCECLGMYFKEVPKKIFIKFL